MRAFVVADAHGNWEVIDGLLRQEGLTPDTETRKNTKVVQLGDLANCVFESVQDDVECLKNARTAFDIVLPGNHEHPYWGDNIPKFWGFVHSNEVASAIGNLNYRAAFAFGGVLVTHAGLAREHEGKWLTADEAEGGINELWIRDPAWALFSQIGFVRNGRTPYGGILWSDWQEAKVREFDQVVGHTPGGKIRVRYHTSKATEVICIDRGAKKKGKPIGGAWIDEDGNITPVTYDPSGGSNKVESTAMDVDIF